MKLSEKTLDKLFPVAMIFAGIAWLLAIILVGILSHSFLVGFGMFLACALFVFGFIKFLDMTSYNQKYSSLRYLYWFSMLVGLVLAAVLLFSIQVWWAWIILTLLQIVAFSIYFQIRANEEKQLDALVEDKLQRERRAQMAAQSTNIRDFASSLGLKVLDMRSDHEKQLVQRATTELNTEDEEFAQKLVAIFREASGLYDVDKEAYARKREEARQIGQILCDHGGNERMTLVAYRVQALGGRTSDCERAWEGICGWMP